MEYYKFSKESGKKISHFNSNFIMSRIIQTDEKTNIGWMHLDEGGVIGYHQAVVPQLLLIITGEGYVCNDKEEYFKVQSGDAVFWRKDEWHETKSDKGLTAILIERDKLNPSLYMPLKN